MICVEKQFIRLCQLACRWYEAQKTAVTSPDITNLGDTSALFTWITSVKYYLRAGHACSRCVWEMCVKKLMNAH